MADIIPKGTWVEIFSVVLPKGERAPQVPEETQKVDLELRARGFLLEDAELGSEARIETLAGRTLEGLLETSQPGWYHTFGGNHAELMAVGGICRAVLKDGVK